MFWLFGAVFAKGKETKRKGGRGGGVWGGRREKERAKEKRSEQRVWNAKYDVAHPRVSSPPLSTLFRKLVRPLVPPLPHSRLSILLV